MKHIIQFVLDKETKGAVRYDELKSGEFEEAKVGTFYIRKSALREHGSIPKSLTVTVEAE